METLFPIDLGRIAQDLQIRKVQVESVVQLLDEGNTVPFVTRYRKERTGGLNEVQIREIQGRVQKIRDLNDRKQTILKAIESQGKLTEELKEAIRQTESPKRLEDLYLPYKPKKRTKASEAREKGFEPLALRVWNRDETLGDIVEAAREFLNAEKGIETTDQVLEGVRYILAEAISELALIRDSARKVVWRFGKIATNKNESLEEGKGLDYRDYFEYSEPIQNIPPHRILAFNRGEKENVLKIKLEVPLVDFEKAVLENLPIDGHPQGAIFRDAAIDALERMIRPSLEREVRRDLSETAERHAVEVFARNLRSLLLQPPIASQVVLAIDPGFRTGCKVAVLDSHGNLIDHTVIYPHPPQNRRHEAKMTLKDLIGKHKVQAVAIGNGTACRETEELVAEIISEGTRFQEAGITVENWKPPEPPAPVHTPVKSVEPTIPAENAEQIASMADAAAPEVAEMQVEPALVIEATTAQPAEAVAEIIEAENGSEEVPPPISGGSPEEDEPVLSDPETGEIVEPATVEVLAEVTSPVAPELVAEDASEVSAIEVADANTSSSESGVEVKSESTKAAGAAVFSSLTSLPKGLAAKEEAEEPPKKKPVREKERSERKEKGPRGPKPQPPQPPQPPAPHVADPVLAGLSYVIVNESGASVYSTSNVGREEFPDYDATLRGVISIGRRLLDPLAELVKIDPQNIGVGLYQHDVSAKTLKETLEAVVESGVNFVGVDLNTASVPLLRHVAGLNQLTARRLVEHRQQHGVFKTRDQILEVEGVGPATFTQAAGFLRILEASNPLDNTWVHPENYEAATKLLEKLGFSLDSLKDKEQVNLLRAKLNELELEPTAIELGVGVPTLDDICAALARPGRDPREDLPKPIFKTGILKLEDLQPGMELKGTVLNVVDFGSFVDIGLKDSGLVHISQLANRYVKSPHDVVSVGDVVTIWVLGVDNDRKRVSLTMVAPGTEREREQRSRGGDGGQRRDDGGGGGNGGEGGGQRGPGPRRDRGNDRGPSNSGGGGDRRPPRRDEGSGGGPSASSQGGGSGGGDRRHDGGQQRDQGRSSRFGRGSQQGGYGGGGGGGSGGGYAQQSRPTRPSRPSEPAKPLSEKEITGAVPLRSFGQLKQFFATRDPATEGEQGGGSPETPSAPQ
ncbi:MAG: S1 RNA-binding domain-containing protein [Planctomycetota bacterium]|nr:MAG: S1 RNA-binding domain-containing protein [Planctomycetota bacterium]